MDTATQTAGILRALQAGRALTPLEALEEFKCMRLGARIWDLRQAGYQITAERIKTPSGKHVCQYRLG